MKTLSAGEACEALGVQPATLYAYVSRGLIRSVALPDSRARAYAAEDVEKLVQKKALRQSPESGALQSLDWGLPVLESAVSRIADGKLSYRGHLLESLRETSLEDLVALLWKRPFEPASFEMPPAGLLPLESLGSFEGLQLLLVWTGTQDPRAFDLSEQGIRHSCERILSLFFAWVTGQGSGPLLERFAGLGQSRRELLRLLLLVCADHELNVSTFAARCVASARATPYAAVTAGLAALEGTRHGGSTRRTEALLRTCAGAASVTAGLRQWLQQGESLPGCGHKLYPEGDPRWQMLAGLIEASFGEHPDWLLAQQIVRGMQDLDLPPPNIDFGLAVAARILAWPRAEALVWFALGRAIGWLAHIQEQYEQDLLIRPRARG